MSEPVSPSPSAVQWLFGMAADNVTSAYAGLRAANSWVWANRKAPGGIAGVLAFVHGAMLLFVRLDLRDVANITAQMEPLDYIYAAISPQSLIGLLLAVFLTLVLVILAMFVLSLGQLFVNTILLVGDWFFGLFRSRASRAVTEPSLDPLNFQVVRRTVDGLAFGLRHEWFVLFLLFPVFLVCSAKIHRATWIPIVSNNDLTVCLSGRACPVVRISRIVDAQKYLIGTDVAGKDGSDLDCRFPLPGQDLNTKLIFVGRNEIRGILAGSEKPQQETCTRLFGDKDSLRPLAFEVSKIRKRLEAPDFRPPSPATPVDLGPVIAKLEEIRSAMPKGSGTVDQQPIADAKAVLERIEGRLEKMPEGDALAGWLGGIDYELRELRGLLQDAVSVEPPVTGAPTQKALNIFGTRPLRVTFTASPEQPPRQTVGEQPALRIHLVMSSPERPEENRRCDDRQFPGLQVAFAQGSDKYNPELPESMPVENQNRAMLDKMIKAITEPGADGRRASHYLLLGEASAEGDAARNLKLSQARASAVCRLLKAGLEPGKKVHCDFPMPTRPAQSSGDASAIRIAAVPLGEGYEYWKDEPDSIGRRRVRLLACGEPSQP